MAVTKKPEMRLDPAKLRNMKEPFIVRVEKMRGSSRMPIELPVRGDGLAPGEGWDKESILKLDNWLATEWSGGGIYRILIVDQDGDRMEWESVFDPRQFPEKLPPTMSSIPPPTSAMQQIQQGGQSTSPPYGAWPPPAWPSAPSQQPGQQPPQAQANGNGHAPGFNGNGNNGFHGGFSSQYPLPGTYPTGWTPNNQSWFRSGPSSPFTRRYSARPWSHDDMMPPNWMPPPPTTTAAPRDAEDKRAIEAERRALQEQINRLERERLEADHKAQMERRDAEHRAQMAALQDEIRRVGERAQQAQADKAPNPELEAIKSEREQVRAERERMEREREREKMDQRFAQLQELIAGVAQVAQTKPQGPDPEIVALKEQMRIQAEQAQRERERLMEQQQRDRERLEAERRMQEIREETRQREAALQRQMELIQQQAQNKGPDPMLALMQQATQQQIQTIKDVMQAQQMQQERLSNYTLRPQDIISLMKESNGGFDELRRSLSNTYGDIFNMQKAVVEHAMQLAGGGGPSLGERILETGVQRVGELADRYLSVQRDRTVSEAKARQAQAEAMAKMAAAQAAQQAAAQAQAQGASPAQAQQAAQAAHAAHMAQAQRTAQARQAHTPAPPRQAAGLSGPDLGAPEGDAEMGKVIQLRRLGHTDQEWFGPALPEIERLRAGVTEFVRSIASNPPRLDDDGQIVGYSPQQCAKFLLIGANRVEGMNLPIRAFHDLFKQERYADFLDVVLPDEIFGAKVNGQNFRDDVVQALLQEMAGGGDPEVDDADDEDNDADAEENV